MENFGTELSKIIEQAIYVIATLVFFYFLPMLKKYIEYTISHASSNSSFELTDFLKHVIREAILATEQIHGKSLRNPLTGEMDPESAKIMRESAVNLVKTLIGDAKWKDLVKKEGGISVFLYDKIYALIESNLQVLKSEGLVTRSIPDISSVTKKAVKIKQRKTT